MRQALLKIHKNDERKNGISTFIMEPDLGCAMFQWYGRVRRYHVRQAGSHGEQPRLRAPPRHQLQCSCISCSHGFIWSVAHYVFVCK